MGLIYSNQFPLIAGCKTFFLQVKQESSHILPFISRQTKSGQGLCLVRLDIQKKRILSDVRCDVYSVVLRLNLFV
jgi:hypothetical protein